MAGAILLRRFFDRETEVGNAGRPYWKKRSMSRRPSCGARSREISRSCLRTDWPSARLQSTTCKEPIWSLPISAHARRPAAWWVRLVRHADVYRADRIGASLVARQAHGPSSDQARMHDTVGSLRRSCSGRTSSTPTLKGAKFDRAHALGARFECARNIPAALKSTLDEKGVSRDTEPFEAPPHVAETRPIRVFMSKPGLLDSQPTAVRATLCSRARARSADPAERWNVPTHPRFGAIGEIQRLMSDCAGAVVFGFKELEVA